MDASLFIAKRLKLKGNLATVCIAVSFLVMIVAVAVSSGFRHEIRDGLSEMSGDVLITPVDMNYLGETSPVDRHPEYMDELKNLDGVQAVKPVVYRACIVKGESDIHGVVFKGIEREGRPLEVSVPVRLLEMLGLSVGEDMLVYFVGEKVRLRKFRIAGTHDSVLGSDDRLVVYASIEDMQRLNGWNGDQVSAIEVHLEDSFRDAATMAMMEAEIGYITYSETAEDGQRVVAESSASRYPQLFDWLALIDFNVLFILVLMTVVAGFNMISGLLIMQFEHISTIGLLKALGMADRAISGIFLASASANVLKGMAAGNLLALLFCLVQSTTHFISLNPENYFVSFVPVHVDIWLVLAADVAVYAVIMLLLLIPSLFISKVDPAKTLTVK